MCIYAHMLFYYVISCYIILYYIISYYIAYRGTPLLPGGAPGAGSESVDLGLRLQHLQPCIYLWQGITRC